ncbi:MAG: polyprenyl synthetase family protein [Methanotrichaceae archaeon]|nr:polyprenyl synthetase family protein [Methanotrichaceae archaeon]
MFSSWDEYRQINHKLADLANGQPESRLGEVIRFILSAPGKRVRPLILVFSAKTFGEPIEECIDAALAIELVHAASLVHDDILDCGIERRGAPSTLQKFGFEAALLAGDYLISRSIELISHYKRDVIRAFSLACMKMAEGEMMDLSRSHSFEDYIECISYKTASLFKASAKIGCLIANASECDVLKFEEYGFHLGLAYQILDDVEEYLGLDQGKISSKSSITLPRILCDTYPEEEAIQICLKLVDSHASASINALNQSSGDANLKVCLEWIVDEMAIRGIQKCRLSKSLC